MEKTLLEAIGESLVEYVKLSLISIGLQNSDIYDNVDYSITDDSVVLVLPDYYIYIENGRKPFSKKVPINIIIKWMRKKGIALSNINTVCWAIQQSIYKKGIKPRPFLESAVDSFNKNVDLIFDFYFDEFTKKHIDPIFK